MKLIKSEKGMTMVEIVVSLAILSIVAIGIMGFFTDSFKFQAKNQQIATAQKLADDAMEQLKANKQIIIDGETKINLIDPYAVGDKSLFKINDNYTAQLIFNKITTNADRRIYDVTLNVTKNNDKTILGTLNSTIRLENAVFSTDVKLEYDYDNDVINGPIPNFTVVAPGTTTNVFAIKPSKDGNKFLGWYDEVNNIMYDVGEEITINDSLKLVAQWDEMLLVNEVKIGDYVKYQPVSEKYTVTPSASGYSDTQIFKPSNTTLWKVFSKDGNKIELISADVIYKNLTFKGKAGYANAVQTLQNLACEYVNPAYATSARNLGYNEIGLSAEELSKYKTINTEIGYSTVTSFPYSDPETRYSLDTNKFSNSSLLHSSGYVWLSARQMTSNTTARSSTFGIKTISDTAFIGATSTCIEFADSSLSSSQTPSYGVRPIVTLRSDLAVKKGDGTKQYPFEIVEKIAQSYKLTYDANGGNAAPREQTGSLITIPSNEEEFPLRTDYKFKGWAIDNSSKIVAYMPGDQIPLTAPKRIYAVWEKESGTSDVIGIGDIIKYQPSSTSYSVTSSASGVSSYQTFNPSNTTSWKVHNNVIGNIQIISTNSIKTKDGKNLVLEGVRGSANKGQILQVLSEEYINPQFAKEASYKEVSGEIYPIITLRPDVEIKAGGELIGSAQSYKLKYDPKGGSGEPRDGSGTTVGIDNGVPSKSGYKFLGWTNSSDSEVVFYTGTDEIPLISEKTVYAVWKENATLKYDATEGTGAPQASEASVGELDSKISITISSQKPTRNNYAFLGWSRVRGDTSQLYGPNDTIEIESGTTIVYAVWGNKAEFASGSSWYKGKTAKSTITKINILNSDTTTRSSADTWNADSAGLIKCYVEGTILTIVGNGASKIYANEDSHEMFSGFSELTTITGINYIDTTNVKNMNRMFYACQKLTSLDLSNFNTSNVENMRDMFLACSKLTTLDLRSFNTDKVTDMLGMFQACSSLTTLNLSSFNTNKVTYMTYMFSSCSSLTKVTLGANFSFKGNDCRFPTPASGFWYSSNGTEYTSDNVPGNRADTYTSTLRKAELQYNLNGGSGGVPSSKSEILAESETAKQFDIDSAEPTRAGYDFLGWSKSSSSTSASYTYPGNISVGNETITLYAVWKAHTYKVVYKANAPASATGTISGSTKESQHTYGKSSNLTTNGYSLAGYKFTGWNKKADGTGTGYSNGGSVKNLTTTDNGSVTLYAQWTKRYALTELNVGDYVTYVPSSTSYSLSGGYSGVTSSQVFDPSEMTSWQVFTKTSEMIEIISTKGVDLTLGGNTAYIGLVSVLKTFAEQYVNSIYASSARPLGYSEEDLTSTEIAAYKTVSGAKYPLNYNISGFPYEDTQYETDVALMGNYDFDIKSSAIIVASRRYYTDSTRNYTTSFGYRYTQNGSIYPGSYFYVKPQSGSVTSNSWTVSTGVIVTLNTDVLIAGGRGIVDEPYTLMVE